MTNASRTATSVRRKRRRWLWLSILPAGLFGACWWLTEPLEEPGTSLTPASRDRPRPLPRDARRSTAPEGPRRPGPKAVWRESRPNDCSWTCWSGRRTAPPRR